jgi:hypothetical protein
VDVRFDIWDRYYWMGIEEMDKERKRDERISWGSQKGGE